MGREPQGQRGGQARNHDHAENRQHVAGRDERGRRDVEPPDERAPPGGHREEAEPAVHEDRGGDRRVALLASEIVHARGVPADHSRQKVVEEDPEQVLLGESRERHRQAHRPQHEPPLEDV